MVTRMPSQAKTQGFTLLELMIAVAMVAILATIALPSYQKLVAKSNRNLAKTFLLDVAAEQDKHRLEHRSYAANFQQLDKVTTAAGKIYLGKGGKLTTAATSESLFELKLTSDSTHCGAALPNYISAVAIGTQATRDTQCRSYLVCYSGKKIAFNSSGSSSDAIYKECWG